VHFAGAHEWAAHTKLSLVRKYAKRESEWWKGGKLTGDGKFTM